MFLALSSAEASPTRLWVAAVLIAVSAWLVRATTAWYRLRHIPGPSLASVSAVWLIQKLASGRFHDHMCKIGDKYGG